MSEELEDLFPRVLVYKLPRDISDHNPLILTNSSGQPLKNISFQFELSWLKQPDFLPSVQSIWEKPCYVVSAMDRIQAKLKRFKQYFKGWSFNRQGALRKKRNEIHEELLSIEQLEEECLLPINLMQRKMQLQSEMLKMLEEEELYWFKRSHEKWLHEGDNNTKFFQRIANGRKRKNTILSLVNNDEVVKGDEALLHHATEYYKTLFGPASGNTFPLDPDLWSENEKVCEEENVDLIMPFTEHEVKTALFQMEKNKAAGPDRIPIEFYQCCWNIIKEDIMDLFSEFPQGLLNVSRLNYGIITLLPKIHEAEKIQQYRPICLLNCIYKLITKILTLRLEKVADKLILNSQSAFMKGRNIMNGIMALHEILHETKRRNEVGVILKLDFEKAYDKVNWDFLFNALRLWGFSEKWCSWIRSVVTNGTMSVKLNDKMGPYFVSHKGVRQGDPLSPILFNFVADCMARMVRKAKNSGLITGLASNLIPNGVVLL